MITDLQKATGLRVLRRVIERQHSLEREEESLLRHLRRATPSSATSQVRNDEVGSIHAL